MQCALEHLTSVLEGRCRVPANRPRNPDGSTFRQAVCGGAPVLAGLPPMAPARTLRGQRWQFWRTLGEWPTLLEAWAQRSMALPAEGRQALKYAVLFGTRWPSIAQHRALFADRPFPHERAACLAYSQSVQFADRPPSFDGLARALLAYRVLFCDLPLGLTRACAWVESWRPLAAADDDVGAAALSYAYSGQPHPVSEMRQELLQRQIDDALPPDGSAAAWDEAEAWGDGEAAGASLDATAGLSTANRPRAERPGPQPA